MPLNMVSDAFNWIYVGAALVLAFGLLYLRWLISLPGYLKARILLAGSVYVLGALLFEVLGGYLADETWFNLPYLAVSLCEEVLEMLGITLMLDAVLTFLVKERATFRFSPEAEAFAETELADPIERA